MPVYEYRCHACGSPFALRRTIDQRDAATVCPNCADTRVTRLVSTFAAFSHGDGSSVSLNASPCSGCASTGGCQTCGVNRN
ncbi:MAG: zinc ribbon domain-containing protein [Anaerolineae bacterium]